jgi:glutathione S-transferase
VIVLTEKSIPFIRTDIDLTNKPEWFTDLSPLGKVPVLLVGDQKPLFESAVICEYLNEATAGSLHPQDVFEKAQNRSWIEFSAGLLQSISQLYNAKTMDRYKIILAEIRSQCERIEKELVCSPFFSGEKFHLIDAVYGPVFRYFDVLDKVLESKIVDDSFSNINRWRDALQHRPSVRQAVSSDYAEKLIAFVIKRESYLSQLLCGNEKA